MTSSNKKTLSQLLITTVKSLVILLLSIYLIIWIASPLVVRYFAEAPLQEFGVTLSEDSSVRYNPFTSTLTVTELQLYDHTIKQALLVEKADISLHLHRLLFKELYVSEFLLSGIEVKIVKDKQRIMVAGVDITKPPKTTPETPEKEQNTDTTASDITVVIPLLTLQKVLFDANVDGAVQSMLINELQLQNTSLNQVEQNITLTIDALVNDAPLELESNISMQDNQGTIESSFSLQGFSLETLSPLLRDLGVDVSGDFSAKGNPKISISNGGIAVATEQVVLSVAALNLLYDLWVVEGANDVITIADLTINASPKGEVQQLTATIDTQFSQGNVGLQSRNNSVVNWDELNVNTKLELVDMQPKVFVEQVNVKSLNLSEDRATSEQAAIVSLGELLVSDIQFSENHLKVSTISIAGLKTDIKVNADKSIVGLIDTSALTATSETQTDASSSSTSKEIEPVEPDTQSSPALTIELGELQLADAAFIHINDQSVSPVFEQNITIEKLKTGPFDSRNSELESPFELIAKDQEYLKIDAKGHVRPFSEKLNAILTANVKELELPSVSPYVKDGLGFEMKTGQLDVDLKVAIKDDEIDGKTKLFLRGVDMASADEVEQGTIKEGKAMPLNVALGMLKDGQGNIDLDVPLRGNVNEPSFGVESFLGLVIKKAAMSQAKSYLMNTFVPYASVVSVAITGAEYLLKVKFEPLVFKTGEVALTPENQQYLSELVLFMQDKQDIQLKTCAIGTYGDLDLPPKAVLSAEQLATLKAMGKERQDNLKRYLIAQKIASSRILFCAPELDTAKNAQARIELKTD